MKRTDNVFQLFMVLICLILLAGCTPGFNITHDNQYGVRYDIKKDDNESFVLIKLDPKNDDVVSSLRVWISFDESNNEKSDIIKHLQDKETFYCQIFYDSSTDKVHFIKEIII